ncbi:hypothetical protein POL68_16770 [Stigmatella sp. ncwal1]|uniref:Uncharacterized protein n=1 Tax=Stigmatella ashevillensis TaxID=2995309 RepID=A0ABT5DCR9_9BACT|nr:hypothetical protein [Stigmatella ashevillena]MDC0710132.1 hypothetical protein [Stigmatella ashevillena]
MMVLSIALLLTLGNQPPKVPCQGERLALVPFDTLAVARPEARRMEDAVRRAVARTANTCLDPRQQTVEELQARGGQLAPCLDAACRTTQVKNFGAQWLVRGRVLGLGGERTVALVLVGPDGQERRSAFTLPKEEAGTENAAAQAFASLWEGRLPPAAQRVEKQRRGPWPKVLMGAGAVALAAGVGFGLAARSTENRLSEGNGGCTGEGEALRDCFADGLSKGKKQSRVANGLLGAGALLGAGGALFFVWELP